MVGVPQPGGNPVRIRVDQIAQGERTRRDLGDVAALAASIKSRGLLHPPAVRADGERWVLVAGARRLAALRLLGWTDVDATVVETVDDELAAMYAEGEENTERKPFTPTEAVAHAARIEGAIAAAAARRKGGRGKRANTASKLDEVSASRRTDQRTAKAVGMGKTTLAKAKAVVAAADDPTLSSRVRAAAKDAVAQMERTGKVDGAHRKVERAKEDASAVAAFIDADEGLRVVAWRRRFASALVDATKPLEFPIDDLATTATDDDVERLQALAARLTDYAARARAAWDRENPAGLRLVKEC